MSERTEFPNPTVESLENKWLKVTFRSGDFGYKEPDEKPDFSIPCFLPAEHYKTPEQIHSLEKFVRGVMAEIIRRSDNSS